ncbi:MAG: hypothetical protein LUH18_05960 [Oscillospiraceae bacterium]|nr:hypothetical protein [Oscillospiraceae bacterium]
MENKGKLLVSTKAGAGRWAAVIISVVFLLLIVLMDVWVLIVAPEYYRDLGKSVLNNPDARPIIGWVICAVLVYLLAFCIMRMRSHVNVYENGVTGITDNSFVKPMTKIDLKYTDIVSVTVSVGRNAPIVQITTQYNSYSIRAFNNSGEAVRIIKEKIELTKQN